MMRDFRALKRSAIIAILISASAACSSGNNGNSSSADDGMQLMLLSTAPGNHAIGVARTVSPVMNFSSTLDNTTPISSQLTLSSVAGTQTATFAVLGNQVTVIPGTVLLPNTTYMISASTELRGTHGEHPANALNVQFTTADGVWKTAGLIGSDNEIRGVPPRPQIAFDAAGNALAIWSEFDDFSGVMSVMANRYTPTAGWETAASIASADISGDGQGALVAFNSASIAFDPNGNALAVWQQPKGDIVDIWAQRFVRGTGWGTAELIEHDDSGMALVPQVVVDATGHGIAIWEQSDGTRYNIWVNRYAPGTGWGTPELVETNNAGHAAEPRIAMDSAGNALAVWAQQVDGSRFTIWASRFTPAGGWQTPGLIENITGAGDAFAPQLTFDAEGNALAVWEQSDGQRNNIWANRYTSGTGWGAATLIEFDDDGDATNPQVAVTAGGNALAVWMQFDGARNNIWANDYRPGAGWGTAHLIETNDAGDARDPQITIDAAGNALAVWTQSDGTRYHIWANRYTPDHGWLNARLIETPGTSNQVFPQVTVDATGSASAIWYQFDGEHNNIWVNRFE